MQCLDLNFRYIDWNIVLGFKTFTKPFKDVTKLKAFADDKFNVATITLFLSNKEKNTGKRRKCWLPAFSPFPTVFSKAFLFRVVKSLCGELSFCTSESRKLLKYKHFMKKQ